MLTRIKSDPFLRMIPVVILTTSNREEDIVQTYQAGANTYITKPDEYPRYRELVATLEHYWVDTALKVPATPDAVCRQADRNRLDRRPNIGSRPRPRGVSRLAPTRAPQEASARGSGPMCETSRFISARVGGKSASAA